jgi:signal transduction histidine kinase
MAGWRTEAATGALTMKMTIWKVSGSSPAGDAAGRALREAGIGLLEKGDWDEVAKALQSGEASLVIADADAVSALAESGGKARAGLPREVARELSHKLRTPLSAMAGWLHLMETGALDEQGFKRAIAKLQANVEDQVRAIDQCLGDTQEERH